MDKRKKQYFVNLALIGDSQVGKTTIVNRLLGKDFDNLTTSTIGSICSIFRFENKQLDNSDLRINIWDTAGQEKFRSTCTGCIKKADILVFVRDNLNDNYDDWINLSAENLPIVGDSNNGYEICSNLKIILCLNKTDLISENEKKDLYELLKNRSQSFNPNAEVFLISSKNDNDIDNFRENIKKKASDIVLDSLKELQKEINVCLFGPSEVGKTSLINVLLGNEFEESTILTTRLNKNSYNFVDYKRVMKINYYDIPGQEQYMRNNLNVLKKADIILFINDSENLKINFQTIEQKVSIEDKECIFCINKSDLFANNIEKIKKNYKEINKEKRISDIILTSAMKQKGIE